MGPGRCEGPWGFKWEASKRLQDPRSRTKESPGLGTEKGHRLWRWVRQTGVGRHEGEEAMATLGTPDFRECVEEMEK